MEPVLYSEEQKKKLFGGAMGLEPERKSRYLHTKIEIIASGMDMHATLLDKELVQHILYLEEQIELYECRSIYRHILSLVSQIKLLRKRWEELKEDGLGYYEQFRCGEKSKSLALKMRQIETKHPTEEIP